VRGSGEHRIILCLFVPTNPGCLRMLVRFPCDHLLCFCSFGYCHVLIQLQWWFELGTSISAWLLGIFHQNIPNGIKSEFKYILSVRFYSVIEVNLYDIFHQICFFNMFLISNCKFFNILLLLTQSWNFSLSCFRHFESTTKWKLWFEIPAIFSMVSWF
jgi:hypothetical protein